MALLKMQNYTKVSLSGRTKSLYKGKQRPDNEFYTKQQFGPITSTTRYRIRQRGSRYRAGLVYII